MKNNPSASSDGGRSRVVEQPWKIYATSAASPPVTFTSSSNVVGKTEWAMPPAAQTSSNSASARSTSVRMRRRVPDGRDATDGLAGRGAHELGGGAAHAFGADDRGDLPGVDPVRAGGHHEQRRAVGVEHQRVGDLPDLDAQRGGRGRGGRHRIRQHLEARDPGGIGPTGGQIGDDELDVAVHVSTLPRHPRGPRLD